MSGVFPAESVAEYAGYFERVSAERRAAGVYDAADSGGDAGSELRNLRSGVRALRARPVREGSEEYLDSEKYQIRIWDINNPNSLRDLITHVNGIRRSSPALQQNLGLTFHPVDNDQLIAYSKVTEDGADKILVVANVDPRNAQAGFVSVDVEELGMGVDESYQVHDLLTDVRYVWHGSRNYVQLNPTVLPAHIFRVRAIG